MTFEGEEQNQLAAEPPGYYRLFDFFNRHATLTVTWVVPRRWRYQGRASNHDLIIERGYVFLFVLGLSVLFLWHPKPQR